MRRWMISTKSGDGATTDEKRAAINDGSENNEKLNQLGASSHSDRLTSGYRSANQSHLLRKFSSCSINNQRGYFAPDTGLKHRPNARIWKKIGGSNPEEKCNRQEERQATAIFTRGPRSQGKKSVSDVLAVNKLMRLSVRRDEYNLEDFPKDYEKAKFYVIKSISEEDIHKSIKYNVWSSTNHGNRKLNNAFLETQDDTSEAPTVCPIFLFLSVKWSGQFVGVAEMIGKVDFVKTLNFWLTENWQGFFPVKWHIIKDIPNRQLGHIILENNTNDPVTHTRDTQEIGLHQGLEMLKIFKNYTAMTSMLDDYNFYDKREHLVRAKRNETINQRKMKEQEKEELEDLLRNFAKSRKP